MKKIFVALIVLCILLVSCNVGGGIIFEPSEDEGQDKETGIILSLPTMTENDVEDIQEIVIYNNKEEIKHYYADMLRDLIKVSSSKAIGEEFVNPELEVPLEEGEYTLSVKGIGYRGNGFELDTTKVKVNHGENPIKYICKPDKTSYVYLDCDAFIPYWMNNLVSVRVQGESFSSSDVLNIWKGKSNCLKNYGTETVTIKAELADEAKALGYTLEYPETVELKKEHATQVRITIKNESFMDSAVGSKLTLSFNKDGIYSFFNSFSSWFPMENVDTDNDAERDSSSYGFVFSYIPESYEKEIYVPNGLNYDWQSSSWNCVTKAAELHTITRNDAEARWEISTSSQRGQSAWMNVTVDPLPQELIDGLHDLRLYYGTSSIGGWAEKYIPTNFDSDRPRTLEMPVVPGEFEFSSRLTPKEGITLRYDLVPEVKSMKTKAGFEYSIRFLVVDVETGETVQPTPGPEEDQSPSQEDKGGAVFHVSIDPLPQELIDGLLNLRLYYGTSSLGGWSVEYIPTNFNSYRPCTLDRIVTAGDFKFSAKLTLKADVTLRYSLVPEVESMKTVDGSEYNIRFFVVDNASGEPYVTPDAGLGQESGEKPSGGQTTPGQKEEGEALIYVLIDPLPQDMVDNLGSLYLGYGEDTLGGWAEEYIPRCFSYGNVTFQEARVNCGEEDVWAEVRPKDGMTLHYKLVSDTKVLKTEAGNQYVVRYHVFDTETKKVVDTLSDSPFGWVCLVTDPLPQELIKSLADFRFYCGTDSIGGMSGEYIPQNMFPNEKYARIGGVEPGTYSITASMRPKDGMALSYSLVPDRNELDIQAGNLYFVEFRVLENE